MRKAACLLATIALSVGCGGDDDDGGDAPKAGTEGPMVACGEEPTRKGDATYYTFADGSGACGFPATPNDLMIGAMNAPDYGDSAPCGACAHVTGPKGEVTIRVVDLCLSVPKAASI